MFIALAAAALAAGGAETRCGWLHNPTPANWWLVDRHGEWLISAQGGYQAKGLDEVPDMSTAGWVKTNGNYGYGCACMKVRKDQASRRIVQVVSASSKPLRQCRADKRLARP